MTIRKIEEVDEQVRGWLEEASGESLDFASVEDYLESHKQGHLGLFLVEGHGLVGLSFTEKVLWVELLVGELYPVREALVAFFKTMAEGRRIEALPHRPGMVRLMERLGFTPVAVMMRLKDA